MSDKFSYIYEDPTSTLQITGSTPFGIYDADSEFQGDSLNVVPKCGDTESAEPVELIDEPLCLLDEP